MKSRYLVIFLLLFCHTVSSQCFDCGFSIGGESEDIVKDIDKTSDGIVVTVTLNQGLGNSIRKYDFDCNLLWENNFSIDTPANFSGIYLSNTTVDENDNIYTRINNVLNNSSSTTINNIIIPFGSNLAKLNANGELLWVKNMGLFNDTDIKILHDSDNTFIVGPLENDLVISNQITLALPIDDASQYFIAKFDSSGDLVDAQQFGTTSQDFFLDAEMDNEGNMYLTGQAFNLSSSTAKALLTKIDADLNSLWTKEISENPFTTLFEPRTIYYNETNDKLYIWNVSKNNANFYNNTASYSSGCDSGGVILEVSKENGDLENHSLVDNCNTFNSISNGITNLLQTSFMAHIDNQLFILSSFTEQIILGGQIVNASTTTDEESNTELVLHKINLTDFTQEIVFTAQGENFDLAIPYLNFAGPITSYENNLYLTASFTSTPITVNGKTIVNNSINNGRDVLFFKYNTTDSDLYSNIKIDNTCISSPTAFEVEGNFDTVLWNFDDPTSGSNNTATINNPTHVFSQSGTYNVSVTVTCGTQAETVSREVIITLPPSINTVPDLSACEDTVGLGFSSNFDTSNIESQLIGNQNDVRIEYYDSNGVQLPSPLPNPMSNTTINSQSIIARVSYNNNPFCYVETSFQLTAQPLPVIPSLDNLHSCDSGNGFSTFDLTSISAQIGTTANNIEFYDPNFNLISNSLLTNYQNINPDNDLVYLRVIDQNTNCYSETPLNLVVDPIPIANSLSDIIGCDENNDGISESFDTSTIEEQVLNGQTDMVVTYFDQNGNQLPGSLPNPYTNSTPFNETFRVRVTNTNTNCFSETNLTFLTSSTPNINTPSNVYACDNGDGFAFFDTTAIENQIIGNQTGLNILYSDDQGNQLPDLISQTFQNTVPYNQTINVRVEIASNPTCYSETSFQLIVNLQPDVNLEEKYLICALESLTLQVDNSFSSYRWLYQDGTIISQSHEATISLEGMYTLEYTQLENGIECQFTTEFELEKTDLPFISDVVITDLSDNNSLRVIATGDGDFEYSIDGINYQDSPIFDNLEGGIYTVVVRDKNGCGQDSKEVVLIDYPRFFTPNNDGINDVWNVPGLQRFPNSSISIFNRYGKRIKVINPNGIGWNGTYKGAPLSSNDYWFRANLGNGKTFKGHFSLRR